MMVFMEAARLFQDSWKLYRKYYGEEKSEAVWNQLIEEADGLYKKYGKHPFAREMMAAVISEVERVDKEQ